MRAGNKWVMREIGSPCGVDDKCEVAGETRAEDSWVACMLLSMANLEAIGLKEKYLGINYRKQMNKQIMPSMWIQRPGL